MIATPIREKTIARTSKTYPCYKWPKIYKLIFHAKEIYTFVTLGMDNNKFGRQFVVLWNIKIRYIFERYSFLFGYNMYEYIKAILHAMNITK